VRPELAAFHFATLDSKDRTTVEAHLLVCLPCLEAYLDHKRAVEEGEAEPEPAAHVRSKLRRAVADAVRARVEPRAWSWWERPLAIACAVGSVVLAFGAVHRVANDPGEPAHAARAAP
jgi:hypothetical protein